MKHADLAIPLRVVQMPFVQKETMPVHVLASQTTMVILT